MKTNIDFLTLILILSVVLTGCSPGKLSLSGDKNALQLRMVDDVKTENNTVYRGGTDNEAVYVNNNVLMNLTDLEKIKMAQDDLGRNIFILTFTTAGAEKMASISGNNIGRRLAIIIDGRLITAPVIRDTISGGIVQVPLNGAAGEARDLYKKLHEKQLE